MRRKAALLFPTFHGGGAEAVCAWILDALKGRYDIDLFTCQKITAEELNRFYGTKLSRNSFRLIYSKLFNALIRINKILPFDPNLRSRLLKITFEKFKQDYDLVINGKDEIDISEKSIHYIHFAGNLIKGKPLHKHRYIANSRSTAKRAGFRDIGVVYPPVCKRFKKVPWKSKEEGFIIIGRITEEKGTHKAIQILQKVRAKGYEVNLHIVGTVYNWRYFGLVKKMARKRDWVILHKSISNYRLKKLLEKNKYGIHCKGGEPFGIDPAEVLYSGGIPFVRNKGGQTEIVGDKRLIFGSEDEAVEKICKVLSSKKIQAHLLKKLNKRKKILGCDRFRENFLKAIHKMQ